MNGSNNGVMHVSREEFGTNGGGSFRVGMAVNKSVGDELDCQWWFSGAR